MRISLFSTALVGFCFLLMTDAIAQTPCILTCPANITMDATSSAGAVVNFSATQSSGSCGTILTAPASGSVFPVGTTIVTTYGNINTKVYGLMLNNSLITFDRSTPGTVSSPIAITGLQTGEIIYGIDFRPSNGELYGLAMSGGTFGSPEVYGRLYTINTVTGAATALGAAKFAKPQFALAIDFDPVTDQVRLTGADGSNLRLDPDLGTIVATDATHNPGGISIVATGYDNNFPGTTTTTMYGIDYLSDKLYIQGGLNGSTSPNTGTLTEVGPLEVDINTYLGFDISEGKGFAIIAPTGGTYGFYTIDLATGKATLVGSTADFIFDLAIPIPGSTCSFTVTVNSPPTVTINKAATQADPTLGIPIHFTVVFSEDVTGFTGSDISFTGSTVLGTLVATVTGSGSTYNVSVSGMASQGVVVASVPADAAVSVAGKANTASTSTDNVVAFVVQPHNLAIFKQSLIESIVPGNNLGYRLILQNNSATPVFGATVTDVLPAGTTFQSIQLQSINTPVTPNIAIVTSPAVGQNGTVSIYFSALTASADVTIILVVKVNENQTETLSNTATVSGPPGDMIPTDDNATATTLIALPPTITCPGNIVVSSPQGECGATVSFTGENAIVITGTPEPKISYRINSANGGSVTGVDVDLSSFALTRQFPTGVNTVSLSVANDAGSSSCSFTVTVVDDQPPVLNCSSDITVNAQVGQCSAMVTYNISGSENCMDAQHPLTIQTSTGTIFNLSGPQSLSITQTFQVGTIRINVFATDAAGNTATCSFNVTVVDNEKPEINCPSSVTVSCASEIPVPNISAASASDNCGATTIAHVGDIITNQTCANKYTLTRTYKATDGSGNTATCSQLITVDDNTPPQLTGLTSSKQVLWPANHKMVDVILNYSVNDNCVSTPNVTINITSNEPVNGTGDGDTDTDWEIIDDHRIRIRAERAANGTGRIYTITVTVSDGCNASVSATTQVMVVHNITAPHSGNSFKVGSTVAFSGEFWDKPGNKHTAKWQIDGSTTTGAVTEPSGNKNGKVTGSYKFNSPGVYKLQMNVTDQTGVTSYANTNGDLEAIVVIYDPNGGHTYGGGYYDSRAGALVSNPSTGKASYGFAMNYFKNSTNPKGETQFEFKVGDFEFNALNFDYLVISNSMAQFKGTGKIIGGQSGVAFTMTVTDGQLDGSGIDKIRMKIYNKNNGKIIYDNQPGASDAALPTQAVGANSIVVISGMNSSLTSANTSQKTEMEATEMKAVNGLDVVAYPNPSINNFSITVQASAKEKIMMQVVDMYGRIIETRNVTANSITRFGDRYIPGTYFVRIIQGKEHKEIKLVKLSD